MKKHLKRTICGLALIVFVSLLCVGQENTFREESHDDPAPVLSKKVLGAISISHEKATLAEVLEDVEAKSGLNIRYHTSFNRSTKVTVTMNKRATLKVLEKVLDYSDHFFVVIDETTILVAYNSSSNLRDLVSNRTTTFYLANSDVKNVFQIVRILKDSRRAAQNKDLNSITVVGSEGHLAEVRTIIEKMDVPRPLWRVMLIAETKAGKVVLKEAVLNEDEWQFRVSHQPSSVNLKIRVQKITPSDISLSFGSTIHISTDDSQHSYTEEGERNFKNAKEIVLVKIKRPDYRTEMQSLLDTAAPVKKLILRFEPVSK